MKSKSISFLMAAAIVTSTAITSFAIDIESSSNYTHKTIIGKDRYETGVLTAKESKRNNLIIVNGSTEKMVDGLCASVLVDKLGATVLPINPDKVSQNAKNLINNAEKIYIIGQEQAIPESFEKSISEKIEVTRIGGSDRFETSEKIAQYLGDYNKAYIVNGYTGQADAMSMSSVSARDKTPILLTRKTTSSFEKDENVSYTVIGGTDAISGGLQNSFEADRISGETRYETNRKVLSKFYPSRDTKYFTSGETLIDALSGASLSKWDGITLVSSKKNLDLLKNTDTVQIGGLSFSISFKEKNENTGGSSGGSVPGFDDDEIIDGGEENVGVELPDMGWDDTPVGEM